MTRFRPLARFVLAACAVAAVATALAATAWASGYWNVWEGNLPDSSGTRSAFSLYGGCSGGYCNTWYIRMSWSTDSHDMYFLLIGSNGTWHNYSAQTYGNPDPGYFDEWLAYDSSSVTSGVAQAGCQNPAGYVTVWTNCRNAASF